MTVTSLLTLNPSSKEEIETFVNGIISSVKDGAINPLEVHIRLSAMEKACEIIKKEIRSNVMNEADRYSEKQFMAFGGSVEKTETGIRYDYSNCGDVEWDEAMANEKKFADIRKEREKFLQTIKKSTTIVSEETGEVVTLTPPVKSSSSFIKVTMK